MSCELTPRSLKMDVSDIYAEDPYNLKAILISDLHVGFIDSVSDSIPKMTQALSDLINKENPNVIFILGDIVHKKVDHFPWHWISFYKKLDEFRIPFHIIPGNHDRYIHGIVKTFYSGTYVHLHNKGMMRLFLDRSCRTPVIMGHDMYNDLKVHGTSLVRRWIALLRDIYAQYIPEDSLMILGHCHEIQKSTDKKSHVMRCFSADLGQYYYGVLTTDENHNFDLTFKNLYI